MISPEQAEHIRNELQKRRGFLKVRLSALEERKQRAKASRKSNRGKSQAVRASVSQVGTKISTKRGTTQGIPSQSQIEAALKTARKAGVSEESLKELGLL